MTGVEGICGLTATECQQILVFILLALIGIAIVRMYKMGYIRSAMATAVFLSPVVHGIVFVSVVLYRHMVIGDHDPSKAMTLWSGAWRLHYLAFTLGALLRAKGK